MLTFNTDRMIRQSFPFPAPIMDYIFENVQPQHLIKLYPCCKFFYAKFRKNIIQHLEIVDDGEPQVLDPTKTAVCISNRALQDLQHFWITDSLIHRGPIGMLPVLPLFSHCTVKKLELRDYILSTEFEYLTKAKTIEELKIKGVYGGDKTLFASVEEIIAHVPNASSIEISESFITATTWKTLLSLKHNAKLSNFVLQDISSFEDCVSDLIFDYFYKNADVNCNVHFAFKLVPEDNDVFLEAHEYNEALKSLATACMKSVSKLLDSKKKIFAYQKSMIML